MLWLGAGRVEALGGRDGGIGFPPPASAGSVVA
jgi:hypothetical protein